MEESTTSLGFLRSECTMFISKFCCSSVSKQGRIYFKLKYIAAIFKRKEYGVI